MSGATTATDASAEDVCAVPEDMRRLLIPRRGGTPGEPLIDDPKAAAYLAAWLDEHSAVVEQILDDPRSEAGMVREYRACKGDLASATPLAAAVAAAIVISPDTPDYEDPAGLVDAWIATRGQVFAAAAAVELFDVKATGRGHNESRTTAWLYRKLEHYENVAETVVYFDIAVRLRRHLASAAAEDYEQASETLTAYRKTLANPTTHGQEWSRSLTSFLMPDHVGWVEEDFALFQWSHLSAWLTVSSITSKDQVAGFPTNNIAAWTLTQEPQVLWTAVENLGADFLPILARWRGAVTDSTSIQLLLSAVAAIPSAEALHLLLDNIGKKYVSAALQAFAANFPRRTLRVLADAAPHSSPRGLAAANLLRRYVLADHALVRDALPNLAPATRGHVEKVLAANVRVPDAAADALPPLFVDPPWLAKNRGNPAKPVVISGLTAPTEVVMAWRDEERERWASVEPVTNSGWRLESWSGIAGRISAGGTAGWYQNAHFAIDGPEDDVRAVLPVWKPDTWEAETWVPRLAVRFGADALPTIMNLVRRDPGTASAYLAPYAAPEVAVLMADWLSRMKSVRTTALAWLTRHPGVAARTLIPVALGKPGKDRNVAELTIRTLAARGFTDEIVEAAAGYGEAVAQAVAAIVADDGTLTLPKVMPVLPDWADPRTLPQVLLDGRQAALPEQSVEYLLLMLAVSKSAEPYPGIQKAKDICDPASLAAFAWALFESWRGAEYPPKESWAFDALRWLGDDDSVRRLSPMIRLWPGENGHQRAVAGLDVLADIGGTVALTHLYDISQKVKFKALKERATQRVTDIAEDLGLTSEQLGDRLVPDLGLASSGTLELDYGPRRFTVGFDEQLKPFVVDQAGRHLKTLPKPGAKDDAELAPDAYQRFSGLKKDARTLAAGQIARFELAMVTQRRWTSQEFGEYFVGHPLLRHIVRRLIWATFEGDRVGDAFRVAEDQTFADVSDEEYTLADDASVGIAHPVHLGEDVSAWSDVFADYEILQPFEQLGRTVYTLTDEEKASTTLTRFDGLDTPVGKVLNLERRGWLRGVPQDAGIQGWISRPLPGGGSVTVDLDPGVAIGYVTEWGQTQRFLAVFISPHTGGEDHWSGRTYATFGRLDALTASEVLRDLTEAMAR